jgi:hypothetical protein
MPPVTASSRRHRPAIDNIFGACDGGGARRGNKRDKVGDFFGFGWTTEWYPAETIHDYLLPRVANRTAASVSTQPGETRTTRTPLGLTSLDSALL